MRSIAVHRRDVVADALARLVDRGAWSGSVDELHAAIGSASTPEDRADAAWPGSAVVLACRLLGLSDALRERGLRMSRMPDAILVEPLPPFMPGASRHEPPSRRELRRRQ